MQENTLTGKTALITGGARRVGAEIARTLHGHGMNLDIHYRGSRDDAHALKTELERQRVMAVALVQADLLDTARPPGMVDEAAAAFGRLDALVNNASSFYPTPVGAATEHQWDDLIGTNLKAPFFIAQAAWPHLKKTHGCIVNIADIHAERPLGENVGRSPEDVRDLTAKTIAGARAGEEGQEGIQAFLERRAPAWREKP